MVLLSTHNICFGWEIWNCVKPLCRLDCINTCHAEYFWVLTTLLSNFYSVSLQHSSCKRVYSFRGENSEDPDQMASLEASWSGSCVFKKGLNQDQQNKDYALVYQITFDIFSLQLTVLSFEAMKQINSETSDFHICWVCTKSYHIKATLTCYN